jgi:predicted nucleotidyltransferase
LGPFRTRIRQIAKRYHAREIRVFGSVARGSATSSSDVDFLVDLDGSGKSPSALRTIELAVELESLLHRHVDVATESSLHWFIQPQVVVEAVPL